MARRRRSGAARRHRRPVVTLGLLILASITIITLDYRGDLRGTISSVRSGAHDVFSPFQGGVDAVLRPVGSFLAGMVNYGALQQENAKLRQQVAALQGQHAAVADEQRRLDQLAGLVHLPWADVSAIPTVTAQVTDRNASDFADTIELDRGRGAGVATGMPVVSGSGLVGRVTQVWSTGCTVQLITDGSSAVSVVYGSAGAGALVAGRGAGHSLEVDDISPGTVLSKGLVLTTSGLPHDLFPPGIPVGTIATFSSSASATQQAVTANPEADLAHLQYVDVLQWEPAPVPPGVP